VKKPKRPKLYPTGIRCPLCGDEYMHSDCAVAVHARHGRMAYTHEPEWFSLNPHVTTEQALHGMPAHRACAEKHMPDRYAAWRREMEALRAQMEMPK
jgi:hypothetical protein